MWNFFMEDSSSKRDMKAIKVRKERSILSKSPLINIITDLIITYKAVQPLVPYSDPSNWGNYVNIIMIIFLPKNKIIIIKKVTCKFLRV